MGHKTGHVSPPNHFWGAQKILTGAGGKNKNMGGAKKMYKHRKKACEGVQKIVWKGLQTDKTSDTKKWGWEGRKKILKPRQKKLTQTQTQTY